MADVFAKAGFTVDGLYVIAPQNPTENVTRISDVPDYYAAQYSKKTDEVAFKQTLTVAMVSRKSVFGAMAIFDAMVELKKLTDKKTALGGHNVEDCVDEIMCIEEGAPGEVCPGEVTPDQ